MTSSSSVVGERKLFSNVTRMGFAAGHDSPALKIEENNSQHDSQVTRKSSGTGKLRIAFLCFRQTTMLLVPNHDSQIHH